MRPKPLIFSVPLKVGQQIVCLRARILLSGGFLFAVLVSRAGRVGRVGDDASAMTEAFGIKLSTLKAWIDRSTNPNAPYLLRRKVGKKQKIGDYAYEQAQNAEEWLSELRKQMRGYVSNISNVDNHKSVYIICGKLHISKSAENLYDIAMLKTGINSLNENVFAFCGNKRNSLRYIYNDGRGLRMISCRKSNGTYPWQSPNL